MTKRPILFLILSLGLIFTAIAGYAQADLAPSDKAEMYQLMAASIKELHAKQAIPKARQALQMTFQAEDYFSVLKNISLEENWRLGFVYCRDENGAAPILIAYQTDDEFKTLGAKVTKAYRSAKIYGNENYWEHIKLNGTEDAYFEYVVLSILGSQFSLDSRANYNDIEIVCTKPAIQEVIKLANTDDRFMKQFPLVDPTPSVTINPKQAIVRVVVFTKWGGLIERKYFIGLQFPYKIQKVKARALAKLKCDPLL